MYSNITKEMASRIVHRGTNRLNSTENKSLNDKLLQAVTRVRSLEDQLLAEQYRQQLLLDQNYEYKQDFQRLRDSNEVQQKRITKLQSEMNLHQVKNEELQTCENSLRAIYAQINELTRSAKIRGDECQLLVEERQKFQQENRTIRVRNFELESRQTNRNETVVSYLKSLVSSEQYEQMNPLSALQSHYLSLKDSLYSLKSQETRIRRELSNSVSIQKELLIKLQYEQQLLTQRGQDLNKIEELTKICQNQQNLEAVVQDMLEKQDELVAELDQRTEENKSLRDQYEGRRSKLRRQWQDELQIYARQIREARRTKEKWVSEIAQCESRLQIVTEQYQTVIEFQAQSMRMDVNLISMRQLREAEERNKHLKLQINEMEEMRNLLQQEKEILHPEL